MNIVKIVAASCANIQQVNPQPVWSEIRAERPDVLLLLGDNIYLDHDRHSSPDKLRRELRRLYAAQLAEPHLLALLTDLQTRSATSLATYDDHDFLGNNRNGGDHDPDLRAAAREEFIRAFTPILTGADIFRVVRFPLVDIIALDTRFYRRSATESKHDRDAMLGAPQWAWLEETVATSGAKFLIVSSSTTFHCFGDESWEQYPSAFERMRGLLGNRRGALLVTGDAHRNALYDDSGVIEVVTSGVARTGLMYGSPRKNYGVLTFSDEAVRIDLRSLKAGSRFDLNIALANWTL